MNRYDLGYGIAGTAALPFIVAEWWRHGKYRRSLPGMFGAGLPRHPLPAHAERVWMHAVSVGETIGAGAVHRVLRARFPDWEVLSTATTETGFDTARRVMADAHYHDFAPIDFSGVVRRFVTSWRPSLHLVFETEIWPNRLLECGRRGLPVFLVNGTLSERSARRYARFPWIFGAPLSQFTALLMQSQEQADRMRALVGGRVPVHVTGNVKVDGLPAPLSLAERVALRRAWGVGDEALVVLAGSTHAGEERLVAEAFGALRARVPTARLVIAARNPERFAEVAATLASAGCAVHRLSCGPSRGEPVLLIDSVGVLARAYGAADLALVGGSWAEVGGHNLLEPAAHGVPVLHGPHMRAQRQMVAMLAGASLEVEARDLAHRLLALALDPHARADAGARARAAVARHQGAAQRTVDLIEQYLPRS